MRLAGALAQPVPFTSPSVSAYWLLERMRPLPMYRAYSVSLIVKPFSSLP